MDVAELLRRIDRGIELAPDNGSSDFALLRSLYPLAATVIVAQGDNSPVLDVLGTVYPVMFVIEVGRWGWRVLQESVAE